MDIYPLKKRKADIELLMEYAVPKEHMKEAMGVLARYEDDVIALNLLHEFYSYLPEAADEAVSEVRLIARKQGACLFYVKTQRASYFYISSVEGANFLGTTRDGVWDEEVLDFFDLGGRKELLRRADDPEQLPIYLPVVKGDDLCPVCAVVSGEYHVLGCPVETCPWCEGQLTRCNCRFEQLHTDQLTSEGHIEALQQKISGRGRIPFDAKKERPGFPVAHPSQGP